MRPACVFANPSDSQSQILTLLHGRHRVATRMIMILLSLQGWPPTAIAALLGYHPATVRRWIHRYNTQDLPALTDRPRPGAPRLGSPSIGMRIRRLLSTPRAWTIGRIWRALGRPAMSLRTVHRRVREQARWRRPRLVAKQDPDAESICAGIRTALSALPPGSVVLAEDETHLMLLPWVRATWIVHGTRTAVMTPGSNERRTVFGALNLVSGAWHYLVAGKADSAAFIAFAARLLQIYAAAPVVALVCDNGSIHHSRATRAWLAEHPHLQVLYGARYSPHHNPVERIWAALKACLANSPRATMAARIGQVHAFFRWSSPAQLLVTAAPASSPWLPEGYAQNLRQAA
jgi:transposase